MRLSILRVATRGSFPLLLGGFVTLATACGDTPAVADSGAPLATRRAAVPPRADTALTPAHPDAIDRLITAASIGPIRLRMTLDDVRRAVPTARFERTSDGDGAALVAATLAPDATVVLWAGEDDADAPVDWSRRIQSIETFDAPFHTAAGVHPGSLVADVERVYGTTKVITLSEIESRQYIAFESQPASLTFRLDYTGIFEGGTRTTKVYSPKAKILSIAISSAR